MRKLMFLFPVFFLTLGAVFAQNSPLPELDAAVKELAININRKLSEEGAQKVALTQFFYQGALTPLSAYWVNQLVEELTKFSNTSYTVLRNAGEADRTISGEIIAAAGTIRVFTRIVRAADRGIAASFHSDIERTPLVAGMLAGGESGGRSSSVFPDAWEVDDRSNPLAVEMGSDANSAVMERTLHFGGDEDFFLLEPAAAGRLVIETIGSTDTYLSLFDAATWEGLASNDDGASGGNARIRHQVEAGKRYVAVVKGYDDDETGTYSFRAYISAAGTPDEYEDDNESSSAKPLSVGTPQRHSFHNGDDVDWVKFEISQGGRYTIRARGVTSTTLDTYIELFDAGMNAVDDNDDGGDGYDSRLSLRLESGLYYLKVECLDDEPDEPYNVSVTAE